jgi:hypothetical protein
MLCHDAQKGLCKIISQHIFSWAVNEMDGAAVDHPVDKVALDVNVPGVHMILMVF